MEPIYRQQFHIDPVAVDCFGRLKPSMLLLYAQEVAGHHSDLLSFTHDALASRGLFWAVIRNRVQITRLPKENETITIETWPMPTTRTAYPRSTVAYDAQGQAAECSHMGLLCGRSENWCTYYIIRTEQAQ